MSKRYETREEILKAINREKKLLDEYVANAEKLERESNELFKLPNGNHALAQDLKSEAKVWRKKVYRKETVRIPKLGRTLAAFDTQLLGFDGNTDESVTLEK